MLVQANFGENQGSFYEIKATPENKGVCQKQRKTRAERISNKVDKLLRRSWKMDKHRHGEQLDQGPTMNESIGKWTNLILLGLGFL